MKASVKNRIGAILAAIALGSAVPVLAAEAPLGPGRTVIASDAFQKDLSQWSVQAQDPATRVAIKDGALDVYAPEGVTIWFHQPLSGDYTVQFDALPVVESFPGYPDRVSDLNVFWNAQLPDPGNPDPSIRFLNGALAAYNPLHLYYVGLAANGNKTARLRKYDGTSARPQIAGYADAPEQTPEDREGGLPAFAKLSPGQTAHVRIVSRAATAEDPQTLKFFVNEEPLFAYADPAPYTQGWFAFRTTKSHFRFMNFKVVR
jgi:hypothetical protein